MAKRYLVTGGTGFLGRSIVTALLKEGHHVTILDNQSRGSIKELDVTAKNLTIITGDIRDLQTVKKACKDIDAVVHLAFVNGTENFYKKPDLVLDVGVKGMINILDAAIASKVKEFFLASSSEVYNNPAVIPTPEDVPLIIPDPFNPRFSYSGGKIISELLAINASKHFVKTVIFRPHNVYGPAMGYEHVIPQFILRMNAMKGKKKKEFVMQGDGKQSRAFIYIDDFTSGLLLLFKKAKGCEVYNIGTQDEITIKQLALHTAEIMEQKIAIVPGTLTKGSPERRCPDISKLTKLGFKPSVTLQEGLQKTIDWYTK